jgi:lambda repressor-like predicted transcriptional regulator
MNELPSFASQRERHLWVKARLELLGTSFSAIARAHGWSPVSVHRALSVPLDRQEKAIAQALRVSQQALFPERYDEAGKRLHRVVKHTGDQRVCAVNESAAA